jgi:hypothetical protein
VQVLISDGKRRKGEDEELALPFGAIVSPSPPPPHILPIYAQVPAGCSKCGAFASAWSPASPAGGEWHCTFCQHLNRTPNLPPLTLEAVDYAVATDPGPNGSQLRPAALVLAIDTNVPADSLQRVAEAVLQGLHSVPNAIAVGLVAVGAAVAVYRLTQHGAQIDSDILPPDVSSGSPLLNMLSGTVHLAPLGQCRQHLAAVLKSLTPHNLDSSSSSSSSSKSSSSSSKYDVCTQAGIEVAIHLARLHSAAGAESISSMAGGPTATGRLHSGTSRPLAPSQQRMDRDSVLLPSQLVFISAQDAAGVGTISEGICLLSRPFLHQGLLVDHTSMELLLIMH